MTKNINIAIPTELHQALRQEAFDRNMTLKALIIAILSGKQYARTNLQTLEFNLYCLRAWNISAYERDQAIKQTREAIAALRGGVIAGTDAG